MLTEASAPCLTCLATDSKLGLHIRYSMTADLLKIILPTPFAGLEPATQLDKAKFRDYPITPWSVWAILIN